MFIVFMGFFYIALKGLYKVMDKSFEDDIKIKQLMMNQKPNYHPPSQMNPNRSQLPLTKCDIPMPEHNEPIEITTYGDAERKYLRSDVGWSGDVYKREEQNNASISRLNANERKPLSNSQIKDGIDRNMTYDEYQSQSKECKEMTS